MNIKDKIMNTLLELVSVPGIAGTKSEGLTAEKTLSILEDIPYFQQHRENLNLIKIKSDPLNRSFVSALFCSSKPSKKTIILTGHLDVVDIEDYGHLKELAFNPIELKKRIKELPLDKDAINDLESGDYIFGRGTADMKFGLALHIELLRELSSRDDFEGNILFLAVPGEESNSEGMLAAVPHLLELNKKYGYKYIGLFVSECCIPKEIGDETKRIYLGTAGKVMPLFLFVGKETHVYESFSGLNPNLLATELNRLLELNPDFCDINKGNITPPPTCLKQTDLKELYSVQTPLMAASYYNVLTLNLSIDELIEKLKNLCFQAFHNTLNIIEKSVNKFASISNRNSLREEFEPKVLTYEEVYKKVKETLGDKFDTYIQGKIEQWINENMDLQTIAINIMKETYLNYSDKSPAIIIGFAPPYYPDKHLIEDKADDMVLLKVIDNILEYAKDKFNTNIEKDHYYMALCDLSYTGITNKKGLNTIASNILGINKSYNLPVDELSQLDIPSIAFGGFGKDFHKFSERLNISYSFEVVPNLYEKAIYELFNN
ncbi:M20/M25/M40 family metallo-hydrolase [Clostridium cochlearium]|uniref:M20/M25/M40 family metallo-hydrolase n=1 Tax=Clostridium cochlearium TaxID=1494 RepID=UPI001EDFBA8B|nr:M20/M25/M40 family metallo-hydrolase [Clostridium cochlearium]MCG4580105.1 M20/M25/M40 family metallo-hydrolase [Clostridium cochlearium]MCR1970804.1 M20/M25/M40 family metallo-hydrolase [Clostridium cochlearium]